MSSITGFYGFDGISCHIVGPGGEVQMAYGSGSGEEGLTFEPAMDQTTAQYGADGFVAFSNSPVTAHTITARFSKLSPTNTILQLMADLQQANSSLNGTNTITIRDVYNNTGIICENVAFSKWAPINYAKDAGIMEWTFIAAHVQRQA